MAPDWEEMAGDWVSSSPVHAHLPLLGQTPDYPCSKAHSPRSLVYSRAEARTQGGREVGPDHKARSHGFPGQVRQGDDLALRLLDGLYRTGRAWCGG